MTWPTVPDSIQYRDSNPREFRLLLEELVDAVQEIVDARGIDIVPLDSSSLVPLRHADYRTGMIAFHDSADVSLPDGWLLCDGSTYDTSLYPELFAVLGRDRLPFIPQALRHNTFTEITDPPTFQPPILADHAGHPDQLGNYLYTNNIAIIKT